MTRRRRDAGTLRGATSNCGPEVRARIPVLEEGSCQIWWARPRHARPWLERLLDQAERDRRGRLHRKGDQDRSTVAVALTRLVIGRHTGRHPSLLHFDRTCATCGAQHGKPRLTGDDSGLQFSVSHSGERVAVAVVRGAGVGVDVEQVVPDLDVDALARQVLSEEERAALGRLAPADRQGGFLTFWTKKEALLKATGDGLRVPLPDIVVSGPADAPLLQRWSASQAPPAIVSLHVLHPGAGYVASLAVIGLQTVRVFELDAGKLLAQGP
jgi:4'-phosphopantetheinyl transferase